jgi:hypothetical protein
LEPVLRVRLIVEGVDLNVTLRAVQGDRFGQRPVRLEPYRAAPVRSGRGFELREKPAADPQSASGRRDPHSLDLGRPAGMELQGAATDRIRPERRNEHQAGRKPELVIIGGNTGGGIEPRLEAAVELKYSPMQYRACGCAGSKRPPAIGAGG